MATKQKMVNGKKYRLVNNKWVRDYSWGKVNKNKSSRWEKARKPKLTRRQQREAEKKERKDRWDKYQTSLKKKGQDQMNYKQRQADDELTRRTKLIKGQKKFRWFGRLSKDEKKRIERMEKDVHRRYGTKKENLKVARNKSKRNHPDYTM